MEINFYHINKTVNYFIHTGLDQMYWKNIHFGDNYFIKKWSILIL